MITKKKNKKVAKQSFLNSYTKRVVTFVLVLAEAQICCTYVLAFLDKTQVAEALSSQTTITIVGVILAYCVKALFENLSKHGALGSKKNYKNEDICSSENNEEENAG